MKYTPDEREKLQKAHRFLSPEQLKQITDFDEAIATMENLSVHENLLQSMKQIRISLAISWADQQRRQENIKDLTPALKELTQTYQKAAYRFHVRKTPPKLPVFLPGCYRFFLCLDVNQNRIIRVLYHKHASADDSMQEIMKDMSKVKQLHESISFIDQLQIEHTNEHHRVLIMANKYLVDFQAIDIQYVNIK